MPDPSPVPYELFALRYATRASRRGELFIGDPHEGASVELDYYIWLARRPGHVCLIDTGFDQRSAKRRDRHLLRNPIDSIYLLGTDPHDIQDVILTHFHYDHAGNLDRLPGARFHVQDREMQFATGRYMANKAFSLACDVEDITGLVRRAFDGALQFHDGDSSLSDGITLHHVGGHTMGQQFVRVFTRRGWVVVASDASHFYEGYLCCSPKPLVFHMGEMVRGFEKLKAMADSDDHMVPSHDPLVMHRYRPPAPELLAIAVRNFHFGTLMPLLRGPNLCRGGVSGVQRRCRWRRPCHLQAQSSLPVGMPPAEFAPQMREDARNWGQLLKAANITA